MDDSAQEEPEPASESPEALAQSLEFRRILERAVDTLPDKHRAVFVMRDIEGMSGNEVSEALDISEVDVRVALHRARARIKVRLGTLADHATTQALRVRRRTLRSDGAPRIHPTTPRGRSRIVR